MSMNISFVASRKIIVVKTGAQELQKIECPVVWQTPSEVSYRIAGSSDQVAAYIEWVKSCDDTCKYELLEYAEDDVLEQDPIRTITVDPRVDHISEFKDWVDDMVINGWEVKAVVV